MVKYNQPYHKEKYCDLCENQETGWGCGRCKHNLSKRYDENFEPRKTCKICNVAISEEHAWAGRVCTACMYKLADELKEIWESPPPSP